MAAVATAALTGCGSKENKVETTEFVDDVKVSLADSGRIDLYKVQVLSAIWTVSKHGSDAATDDCLYQQSCYFFSICKMASFGAYHIILGPAQRITSRICSRSLGA